MTMRTSRVIKLSSESVSLCLLVDVFITPVDSDSNLVLISDNVLRKSVGSELNRENGV